MNKRTNNWLDQAKRCTIKIQPTAVGKRHFQPFFLNFDKCRPKVAGDVISGVAVDKVGMDVRVKFGDSRLAVA